MTRMPARVPEKHRQAPSRYTCADSDSDSDSDSYRDLIKNQDPGRDSDLCLGWRIRRFLGCRAIAAQTMCQRRTDTPFFCTPIALSALASESRPLCPATAAAALSPQHQSHTASHALQSARPCCVAVLCAAAATTSVARDALCGCRSDNYLAYITSAPALQPSHFSLTPQVRASKSLDHSSRPPIPHPPPPREQRRPCLRAAAACA